MIITFLLRIGHAYFSFVHWAILRQWTDLSRTSLLDTIETSQFVFALGYTCPTKAISRYIDTITVIDYRCHRASNQHTVGNMRFTVSGIKARKRFKNLTLKTAHVWIGALISINQSICWGKGAGTIGEYRQSIYSFYILNNQLLT